MIKTGFFFLILFGFSVSGFAQSVLSIGETAPMADQSVEDVNSRSVNLSQITQTNGLLVVFSGNTCPWVTRWEERLKSIASTARSSQIGMIVLNPNERIRGRGESIADMKRRHTKRNYNFVYALDKDHILADAFGATKTPEVFLFDGNMKLVYKGTIDDNPNDAGRVEHNYLQDAVDALLTEESISNPYTEVKGCPIKRIQ